MSIKDNCISRRDFLKHTALGVAGAGIGISGFRNLQVTLGADEPLPSFDKSRVIAVKRSGIMKDGKPDSKIIQNMMNEGMFTLTGKKTTAEAWRTFFTPEDVVGIKVNPIGGVKLSTRPEVVNAIVLGLIAAGVKKNNI